MKTLLAIVVIVLALLIIGAIIVGLHNNAIRHNPQQKIFASGQLPYTLPNGIYAGSVVGYHGDWQGKTFAAATKTGFNNFRGNQHADPFHFYTGPSLTDSGLQVLKIDYNQLNNPFWLRHVIDEVVQTAPGHYLGKIQVRLPGFVYTSGYFSLQQ